MAGLLGSRPYFLLQTDGDGLHTDASWVSSLYPALHVPAQVGVAAAVAFTLFSGLDYLWRFRHVVRAAAGGGRGPAPAIPGEDADVGAEVDGPAA